MVKVIELEEAVLNGIVTMLLELFIEYPGNKLVFIDALFMLKYCPKLT